MKRVIFSVPSGVNSRTCYILCAVGVNSRTCYILCAVGCEQLCSLCRRCERALYSLCRRV